MKVTSTARLDETREAIARHLASGALRAFEGGFVVVEPKIA